MAITQYRKARTSDINLRRVQDAIEPPFRDIASRQILDGRLIRDVDLVSSADNVINHGLGRDLIGWLVVGINAAATIYDKQSTNDLRHLTLILDASANCRVNVWVF